MSFLRKYNTLTVTGTTAIRIPMIKRGVVDFAVGADWTPAAGDVKIAIDGAAPANVTNLPTAVASGNGAYWEFILTAAELSCKQAIVTIVDSATKAVEDQAFLVETFGNASAMYQADLSAANLPVNVIQVNGTAQTAGDIPARLPAALTANGNIKASLVEILTTALTETAGQLAGGFKKFFNIATPASTMDVLARVTLVDTLTTYTGNTVQTGDSFGRIGAAGAGLTALGDTRIANLDATVSSRTKPADTQAAVTLVTTTTNLTNAPTAGDLTATMKTSVTTAATAATPIAASVTGAVGSVTGNVNGNVVGSVASVVGAVGSVIGNVGGSVASVVGNVGGSVASVVGNVGGNVVGTVASVVGSIGSIVNAGIDAIFDRAAGVETNYTLRQALRLMLSALSGKLSGAATSTIAIRDINDTKTRLTATVDADGNRSAITTDVS